jgi:2-oxoisovalerate dehydrogenase E2 component (dihydrolipoyl transacylase)
MSAEGQYVFKMPDLGEGTVEAEIVRWYTKPGDLVAEDQAIVEVMTDKASVEVPAPVSGRVVSITGTPGDKVAVGSPLIVFAIGGDAATIGAGLGAAVPAAPVPVTAPPVAPGAAPTPPAAAPGVAPTLPAAASASATAATRVMSSPANRRRAREAGLDLATLVGTGPRGRIVQSDIEAASSRANGAAQSSAVSATTTPAAATTEIKVIGLRRLIAERMSEAKRTIPHFAYVEEVDVTELESLRSHLNAGRDKETAALSYLPFVILALTRTLVSFPQCNVRHDAARGVLIRHAAVHVGIATQTPDGLKVPVVRNAERLSLWEIAAEIRRLSAAARSNRATREELSGSTITVTSLGKLGGIASTPVINAPEVAIIGLNKAVERPVVHGGAIAIRRIMNLSSSFDHRFVDGYDAAAMIQALREYLEHPATIFMPVSAKGDGT